MAITIGSYKPKPVEYAGTYGGYLPNPPPRKWYWFRAGDLSNAIRHTVRICSYVVVALLFFFLALSVICLFQLTPYELPSKSDSLACDKRS